MKEYISKTIPVLLTIPQTTSYSNLINEWKNKNRLVKIVDATISEPMEIIVRDVEIVKKERGMPKTKTYIPEKKEKEVEKKRSIGEKLGEVLIP